MNELSGLLEDELWIRDIETIKVFAHSIRLKIIKLLEKPRTVKALAEQINIPPSKLYYHVNMLERHRLIQVVNHNIEGNLVEKIYQVTAKQFKLINPLISEDFPDSSAAALFSSSLDSSKEAFLKAFTEGLKDEGMPPRYPFFSQKTLRLTNEQLSQLHGKLDILIQELTQIAMDNEAASEDLYSISLLFYKNPAQGESS